jgi:hypothetical protein
MRIARVVFVFALLALPFVLVPSASALDLCEEPHCQPPAAEQNTPFEWEFEAEEGCIPYFFKHTNGNLPPGLEVTVDGKLKGTPTQSGDFDFWVALDDNGGPHNPACLIKGTQSQAHFFMHVMPDLAVTTTSLPTATPGQPYSAQLQFSNPAVGWPVIWDITQGALPSGLSLSASGLISGTPTGAGQATFVVRAREPFRRFGEKQLTLTVATELQARATAGPGEVGLRYRGSVPASGGTQPYTWSVGTGALPAGLTLNPQTGAITGVPTRAGAFAVTFAVRDAGGQTESVQANIRIAARLAISSTRLPNAAVGRRYRARLASSGGVAPKRWTAVGRLPRGLQLSRAGVLSGVVREAGAYRITVRVTDRLGGRSTKTLRLTATG